jgi:uncharacterized protein (DUF58 family)
VPVLPLDRTPPAGRFRPARRLRVLRPGVLLLGGTMALGLATLNTGNNLLYVLLGGLLGMIVLSGLLSERTLRGVAIERAGPRCITAGRRARMEYRIRNTNRRLPACTVEWREAGLQESGFVALIEPGQVVDASAPLVVPRRGVYVLRRIIVSTSFPFGLFRKERDLEIAGSLVVRPDASRPIRAPRRRGGGVEVAAWPVPSLAAGHRGAFRALRPYRTGDDPRDVHWRSTARMGEPVLREYDRDAGERPWLVLELRAPGIEAAERAVQAAASLAGRLTREGRAFGFSAGSVRIAPDVGTGHLDAVLDLLAAVETGPLAPGLELPAPLDECILVSAAPDGRAWIDTFDAADPA